MNPNHARKTVSIQHGFEGVETRRLGEDGVSLDRSALEKSDELFGREVCAQRNTTYDVLWCSNAKDAIAALAKALDGCTSLWVTTPSVARLHQTHFLTPAAERIEPVELCVLPCSEVRKRMEEVQKVIDRAQAANLGRSAVLVSIGGGVVSDVVTMAASMFRRGIRHVRIPTTLLGLVDAGVGVKGAINYGNRKNSLGCFYAPSSVLLLPSFLSTLPERHLRSGLGEVLKAAIATDEQLFVSLEDTGARFLKAPCALSEAELLDIVWEATLRMLEEIEPNLYEDRTYARSMDFGHTFGPVLEAETSFTITHGESVAIDMAFSSVLANTLGLLDRQALQRILSLISLLGLEHQHAAIDLDLCRHALDESILHRGGELYLPLPVKVGEVHCFRDRSALTDEVLSAALLRWKMLCV